MKQKLNKPAEKLTKWKNEPSCQDLKNDLEAAAGFTEEYRSKLLEWEELRDGGNKINARPGKSTARPKVIRKNNEWKYPALEEPFLSTADIFELKPRTWEDVKAAMQNALLINYQWAVKVPKVKLVNDIVRYVVDEGTVVVKVGWEVEEKIVKEKQEQPIYAGPEESLILMEQALATWQMTQEEFNARIEAGEPMQIGTEMVEVNVTKLVKNQPRYEVCNNAHVIIDPTCEGILQEANFLIHEYDTNLATLKKEEYIVDDETKETRGIYKNLDKIVVDEASTVDIHKSNAYNEFKFTDRARKKLKAYDYWGYWDINGDDTLVPIVATWVGNVLIRLEENPFPHKKIPFAMATYMPIKKEVMGEPDAELLKENQESIGKLTRAAHDIISEQAVGQKFIDETFFTSPAQQNQYEKGNTVYYRAGMDPKRAIYKKSVDSVPPSVFSMIQWQQADAESLTGTKAFTGGISGTALGDSVGQVRSALDATSKRELSILRRLSELFKEMARLTIAMNQAYLAEEEVVRITNEEFVTIRRDELQGEFDLVIDVSTPEKDQDTATKLNMLLQTNAASMDPAEARILRAKIARLWKQPDLAKAIESYEPQPDPMQQQLQQLQMQKLQMEIEQMKATIADKYARAGENEIDRELKLAKVDTERAKAKAMNSESDLKDLNFLEKESGIDHVKELEKKQADMEATLNKQAQNAMLQLEQKLSLKRQDRRDKEATPTQVGE